MTNTEVWDRIAARARRGDRGRRRELRPRQRHRGRPAPVRRRQGQAGPRSRQRRGRERDRARPPGRARDRARPAGAAHARPQARGHRPSARVEWHECDAADLAFLRADSIDLALAVRRARRGRGPRPPVAPGAPRAASRARAFVFSYDHPMALAVGREGHGPGALPLGALEVRRSYFDTARRGHARRRAHQVWPARSPTCSRRCTAPATASSCCSNPPAGTPRTPAPTSRRDRLARAAKKASNPVALLGARPITDWRQNPARWPSA